MNLQWLWKKFFFSAALAAVALVLAACSGKGEKKQPSDSTQKGSVWHAEFREVELEGMNQESVIENSCIDDGRLYISFLEWAEDGYSKWSNKNSLISCGLDGSDMEKIEMDGLGKNELIHAMAVDDKGEKRIITEQNQKYMLYTLKDDGKLDEGMELKPAGQNTSLDISTQATVFMDGTLYVGSEKKIYAFDEKGEEKKTYEYQNNITAICRTTEGKLYVYTRSGEDGRYQSGFCELNPQTGKLGEFLPFQENDHVSLMPGEGSLLYLNDYSKIYSCDLSEGKIEEEFVWINQDVDGDNLSAWFPLEDGSFLAIDGNYDEKTEKYQMELITLKKEKPKDGKEKQVLTLAMSGMDYALKKEILSFNKQSEDLHIEVKDYSGCDNPEKQMNLDFAAGNIPDIVNVIDGVSYDMLQKKGMFTDLYPFMETDSEVKKEDFFSSILETLEEDGKLYRLSPWFCPQFLVTSKEIADGREGWTVDEMLKSFNNMKKGSLFMELNTREKFLSVMLHEFYDIDRDTGEISFDSKDFIRLIEYSENFDSEEKFDYEEYDKIDAQVLVGKDKLFVSEVALRLMPDIQQYFNRYQEKGGFAVMAYPSKDQSGSLSMSLTGSALAITAQCKDKDAAWRFVRKFLTYEFEKSNNNDSVSFPTRKDAFEKNLEHIMARQAYIDEDGAAIEPYHSSYFEGNVLIDIGPISGEEADILRDMVSRIGSCSNDGMEDEINNIIEEELGAFYAGDKSAEETAEIIQNRVKLYVSERG